MQPHLNLKTTGNLTVSLGSHMGISASTIKINGNVHKLDLSSGNTVNSSFVIPPTVKILALGSGNTLTDINIPDSVVVLELGSENTINNFKIPDTVLGIVCQDLNEYVKYDMPARFKLQQPIGMEPAESINNFATFCEDARRAHALKGLPHGNK